MKVSNVFLLNSNFLISVPMQNYLRDRGNIFYFIKSSYDLKRMLIQIKPDIVILEVVTMTPELTDLIQAIERSPELKDVPRIAVLNRGKREYVLMLAHLGFQEILLRPIHWKYLLSLIQKLTCNIAAGDFHIATTEDDNGFLVIELVDFLDVTNSMKIDNFIDQLILQKNVNKIALDFKNVDHIDSAGIGILIVCKKKLDVVNGEFKILNAVAHVKDIIKKLNIDKFLDVQ